MDTDSDLRQAMLRWARHDLGATAAVQLLIDSGFLPEKLRDHGYTLLISGDEQAPVVVAPKFRDAIHDEGLPHMLSHSEWGLLQIAASLAGKSPVLLTHALGHLDNGNARHVQRAMRIALGQESVEEAKPKPIPARVRVTWQTEWTREYTAVIKTAGYNLRTYDQFEQWITDGDNPALIEAEAGDEETTSFIRAVETFTPITEES